tara:strand:+ start:35 stop:646 length:612 start_codon:yes stop_codon:yes gene_type:complete
MSIGIYKITNPSGKIYIGSSKNIEQRWLGYKSIKNKSQTKLYNSFKKYGVNNHKFEIVKICLEKDLFKYEHKISNKYNVLGENGLNCVIVGHKEIKNNYSVQTKQKMSDIKKKIFGVTHPMYGRKLSETTKIKISTSLIGKQRSESSKLKQSKTMNKIVVNLNSGIFSESCKEAAVMYNLCPCDLSRKLSGKKKNKTNLIYAL